MPELVKSKIRTIPDWPKKGIMFRDITTLLKDKEGLQRTVKLFVEKYKDKGIEAVAGIESRGFILGSILAHELGVGLVLIRKKGKLPGETIGEEYQLEYGTDTLEIHKDVLQAGEKVLVVDDLIATGGTLLAACNLLKKVGAEIVSCAAIIDLPDLKGSQKVRDAGYDVFSLVEFEGE